MVSETQDVCLYEDDRRPRRSVGLAYQFFPDGSVRVPPWAEFAMLSEADPGVVSIDFRRVPYDRDATVRAMIECEMPHAAWWTADWR
ncbi:MAG: metallophosphoesterase [Thermomicrobiales bacterium]|nr:metallophosphoesterase [Thermomicrobiales bacterium]